MGVLTREQRSDERGCKNSATSFHAPLLDFLLRFGVDLDAFSKEHGVHASLWVGSCGVQQQVGQLCRENTGYNLTYKQTIIPVKKSQQSQFKSLESPPSFFSTSQQLAFLRVQASTTTVRPERQQHFHSPACLYQQEKL